MKTYLSIISDARENTQNKTIPCSIQNHSTICSVALIQNANRKISIVSQDILKDFCWQVIKELNEFLNRDKRNKLEVFIVDLKKFKKAKMLQELKREYPNRINIFVGKDKRKKVLMGCPDFLVTDNFGFRYDIPRRSRDSRMVTGVANFNNREAGKTLINFFDFLKRTVTDYSDIENYPSF